MKYLIAIHSRKETKSPRRGFYVEADSKEEARQKALKTLKKKKVKYAKLTVLATMPVRKMK